MDFEHFAFTHNNSPAERLSGLSPVQFFELTHNPFFPNSPVKLRNGVANQLLDQIPFLKLAESFLAIIIRDGSMRLTPSGKIPVKILAELYEKGHLPDPYIERGIIKLSSEDCWKTIIATKTVCKLSGLIRINKNHFVPVKKNLYYLDQVNREALFRLLYLQFTEHFNWAYLDGYTQYPVGQYGVNFTLYLLLKFGNIGRKDEFYSERYFKGYPNFEKEFDGEILSSKQQMNSCYSVRTFDQFTNWFGFTGKHEKDSSKKEVCATTLLAQIFYLDI